MTRSVQNDLVELEPKQRLVYWQGYLSEACEMGDVTAQIVRREAWDAFMAGQCELVHKRRSEEAGGGFDYIAIKRKEVVRRIWRV